MLISRRALTVSVGCLVYLSVSILPLPFSFASAPIYTYTDDAGILTFTTQWDSIPEKYRSQLAKREAGPAMPVPPPGLAEQIITAPSKRTEQPVASPEVRTVAASGEYRMGDYDTRTDAVRLAVEAAKKDALEQVATFLESVTEVRDMDVTRDDIRTYTAGIVKVVDQTITTRLEGEHSVVIRADLTAEVDPHEVAQAIASLRENESVKQELLALRAETDRLQEQLDTINRALAAAPSSDDVQQLSRQRADMLNELQANGLVSQAWTSVVYASPGFYAYPWIGVTGLNGLLRQAQRLYPRHRHLPLAQQMMMAQPGLAPAARQGSVTSSRQSLPVPPAPYAHHHQSPPLLTPAGVPARVGDVVSIPPPRSLPPVTHQSAPQPPPYQLHPSHFWRPSPPNIQTAPSVAPRASLSPGQFSGQGRHFGGGGHSSGSRSGGGHRGR